MSRSRGRDAGHRLARVSAAALLAVLLMAGCAGTNGREGAASTNAVDAGATRQQLEQGYSLVYAATSGLAGMDNVFYIKLERDRVQHVITDVSDYAGALQARLERLADDYPGVVIDLQPLPPIERARREAMRNSALIEFAPLVGKSGTAFERDLLLSASAGLNQLKLLCRVMAEAETDPALRTILAHASDRFDGLYDEVVVLLNEVYFRHDTYRPDG